MGFISILMYHQVGKFMPMKTHRANYCDVDRFRSQMHWLRVLGVHVLSMTELVAVLQGQSALKGRSVVLTFDDGCVNFMEHALPVLKAYNYPSIVYPIASLAGGKGHWLAAKGHPTPSLMSFSQLREIAAQGVTIGSHANTHTHLAQLDDAQQLDELKTSKEHLQQELGLPVEHVCYPYGSYNVSTLKIASECGYITGMTCERAAAKPGEDMLALPRKAISYGDSVMGFFWKLFGKNQPKTSILVRPEYTLGTTKRV